MENAPVVIGRYRLSKTLGIGAFGKVKCERTPLGFCFSYATDEHLLDTSSAWCQYSLLMNLLHLMNCEMCIVGLYGLSNGQWSHPAARPCGCSNRVLVDCYLTSFVEHAAADECPYHANHR